MGISVIEVAGRQVLPPPCLAPVGQQALVQDSGGGSKGTPGMVEIAFAANL